MRSSGLFITFEGIEGCGKTTQLELLKDYLLGRTEDVVSTREPGGTRLGERVRHILLTETGLDITPYAELLLYEAVRAELIEEVIRPAIDSGAVLLCDRFTDSSVAYQGYGRGLNPKEVSALNMEVTRGLKPDITFLIDCPVKVGLERVGKRSERGETDRFESENEDFHQRVRMGFLKIAEEEMKRVRIIDGCRDMEKIHGEICDILALSEMTCLSEAK